MSIAKGAALVFGGWLMLQAGSKAVKEVHWLTMREDERAVDILARTIWGEARGEGYSGMVAVANVVLNRASNPGWWGFDIASVCLKDWQFSCWNITDPNRPAMLAVTTGMDQTFAMAVEIAREAVNGTLTDNTNGATHYYAKSIAAPNWTAGATLAAVIGNHKFYKGVA